MAKDLTVMHALRFGDLQFLFPDIQAAVRGCNQCGRCSAACLAPVDHSGPAVVLRLLQLSLVKRALEERLLWACIGCRRCSDNCPKGLDVQLALSRLRRLAPCRPERWLPAGLARWLSLSGRA
ncbi:MAG: 4Fe-4S dicluster domain-containing protein [Peptococcaceae bacterium]|nr:4Fe-4S dicluster domain-containing protein [Peptococcaceae bacterium]